MESQYSNRIAITKDIATYNNKIDESHKYNAE